MVSEPEGWDSSAADRKASEQDKDKFSVSEKKGEKLDRSNYASWSYKMHQYLLGHDYWAM